MQTIDVSLRITQSIVPATCERTISDRRHIGKIVIVIRGIRIFGGPHLVVNNR